MVGQLVETEPEEVHEHELGHGPQAPEGGADGRPHDGLLRDGRVADAVGAVLGGQALRHAEDAAAGIGDVLAEEHHPLVGAEGLVEGPGDGGADAHLAGASASACRCGRRHVPSRVPGRPRRR